MKRYFETKQKILAALSEKDDGSMRLFADKPVGFENEKNREKFFVKCGIESENVVSAGLVNGNNVEIITDVSKKRILNTDGLVTDKRGIYLSLTVADCIPVYFYDGTNGIIGLAHAGWRGVVDGVVKNTVAKMQSLGSEANNVSVQFGPGINRCHFEIKEDILDQFAGYENYVERKEGKIHVNLKDILFHQLSTCGIGKENISNDSECTFCCERYFSFRRDKPPITEAMVAVIGMKPE
jgi:YfiH family protein